MPCKVDQTQPIRSSPRDPGRVLRTWIPLSDSGNNSWSKVVQIDLAQADPVSGITMPECDLARVPGLLETVVARKLAKSTVQRFQRRLEEEKTRLEELIQEYERELEVARLTESSSDRSPDPGNAEASSMKMEYAKELSIEQNTVDLLRKVNHALDRVADGDYGICEACGGPIPVQRLDVLPYSTLCVGCAAQSA